MLPVDRWRCPSRSTSRSSASRTPGSNRRSTDAAASGAGSAVTFSSLYEEPGDGPDLRERLRAIAVANGMAMCGGNGMGFMNQESRVRATGFLTPERSCVTDR